MTGFVSAIAFLTRIPVGNRDRGLVSVVPWFPLVGVLVGAIVGGACVALREAGASDLLAAAVAVSLGAVFTGALHEDGLADSADALGAGPGAARHAADDPCLGTFGVLGLVGSFVVRVTALASVGETSVVAVAVGAHVAGRSAIVVAGVRRRRNTADSSDQGLGARFLGSIRQRDVVVALAVACLALALVLDLAAGPVVAVAVVAAVFGRAVAYRTFGSLSGDALGGIEQLAEVTTFVVLAVISPRVAFLG
jgi:adenosylcobinamide-GDP ribazoletransferase